MVEPREIYKYLFLKSDDVYVSGISNCINYGIL